VTISKNEYFNEFRVRFGIFFWLTEWWKGTLVDFVDKVSSGDSTQNLTKDFNCIIICKRGGTMKKPDQQKIAQATKHLKKIRELVSQRPSPFAGMTKDEAIEEIRKVRDKLWEKKFATRS